MSKPERKAALILAGIAASEGTWLYFNVAGRAARFWRYTGIANLRQAGWVGWVASLVCALIFVRHALRLPSVQENLLRISWLKLLALLVAIAAGFCEEAIFRKWLMDTLQNHGFHLALQIAASALVFGLAHAVWGLFRGSIRAAAGAMVATGALGLMLAIVYALSHRVLAPCILAHFLINLFIEPGLVLAAVRGEMGTHPKL